MISKPKTQNQIQEQTETRVMTVTHTFQCTSTYQLKPHIPTKFPTTLSSSVGGVPRYSKLCKFTVPRMGDTVLLCENTSPPWSYILQYCEDQLMTINNMVPQTRQLHWLNRQSTITVS